MNESKIKLLIIDDDDDLGQLVKAKIKNKFEANVEPQASNTIMAIEKFQPDLILLDLNMPNIDGYEVLNIIFSHPKYSSIPIICSSGDTAEDRRSRVYSMGAIGFISKPYDMATIENDILNMYNSTIMEIGGKNNRYLHLSHNHYQKQKVIDDYLSQKISRGEKIIYVGWGNGDKVLKENIVQHLDKELIYLQVKPSLITRFQFLQDLSSIFDDISSLLYENNKDYCFFFDEPTFLFSNRESDISTSKIFSFTDLASFYFKEVHFFISKSKEKHIESAISNISKIFTES